MYAHHLRLVLQHFALMWGLTAIGLLIGMLLPSSIVFPIAIMNIILLIVVVFVRNVYLAGGILYAVPFLTGIMFFWLGQFFIEALGAAFLLSVFFGTVILFIILALVGLNIPRDLSSWGMYLVAILLIVIIFSLIYFFISVSSAVHIFIAALIVLVFALFTVYDFNLIRNHYVKEDEVVKMALSLYLVFINLFIHLLELIYRLKKG